MALAIVLWRQSGRNYGRSTRDKSFIQLSALVLTAKKTYENKRRGSNVDQHIILQHYWLKGEQNFSPHVKWSHYTNRKYTWPVIFWSTNFRNFCWIKVRRIIFLQAHNNQINTEHLKIHNNTALSKNSGYTNIAMKLS